MKRVGIVTLGGSYNYGNRLQAYASNYIYQSLGFDSCCIYPRERVFLSEALKRSIRTILRKPPVETPKLIESRMSDKRLTAFQNFNKYIPSLTVSNKKELENFDFFSVGSDQVWNPGIIRHYEDWYYLKFTSPSRRIALSPSIGLDSLNSTQSKRLKRGLDGFISLSVRENRGAEIILGCTGKHAVVTCDPTLILSSHDWMRVSNDSLTPNVPYIFTYLLGGMSKEASAAIEMIQAVKGQMPIISLSDREKPSELPAGPSEFISLIGNATHVVTDSYHAAIFSAILRSPLTIVHRGGPSMFSRLDTLAKNLNIQNKVFGQDSFDISYADMYSGVQDAIDIQKQIFLSYLRYALSQLDLL